MKRTIAAALLMLASTAALAQEWRGTCKELGYFAIEVASIRFNATPDQVKESLLPWLSEKNRADLYDIVDRVYGETGDQIDLALEVINDCQIGKYAVIDHSRKPQ